MLYRYPNGEDSSQDIRDMNLLYALYLNDHAVNRTLGISFSKKTGRTSNFPDGNWTSHSVSRHPLCRLSCCISQSQSVSKPSTGSRTDSVCFSYLSQFCRRGSSPTRVRVCCLLSLPFSFLFTNLHLTVFHCKYSNVELGYNVMKRTE
jgi:hypothetical protein